MKALPLAYRQIHLDFHTSEKITGVGRNFRGDRFARQLLEAGVNSVTCFSKCHHGLIYHDTRFEARHPHLEVNLLREQIEACHAVDIRVPIYISIGFDEYMAQRHPEWLELQADGRIRGAAPLEAGWRKLCLNTPYVDYVAEQTAEVLSLFPVDGLFFDIIHQGPCCCRWCLAGMQAAGMNPEAEAERKAYAREVLYRLRRRLSALVWETSPESLIFWNSGHVDPTFRPVLETYSHLEVESLPSGGWGYDHFPLSIRYARNLGLECLGMTGKFQKTWAGFGEYKNPAALEYECFSALAEGAKVSVGDQLHPTGDLNPATYDLIGPVYRSVREKEPWCAGSRAVTELAIYNPEDLGVHDGRVDTSAGGAYHMLREAHYQFDVVDREMDWDRYRVLILPDKIRMDASLAGKVRKYLARGGKILASHHSGLAPDHDEFVLPELGVRYRAEARYSPDYVVSGPEVADGVPRAEHVMYDRGVEVEVESAAAAQVWAKVWHPYFDRTWEHFCSHRHTPVERESEFPAIVATENTVYFSHPVFASYLRHGARVYKLLVLNALRKLLPDQLVETNAPTTALITLQRQDTPARTVAHLLHYVPEQRFREIQTIEEALPLYHIELRVKLPSRPERVYLVPEQQPLPFTWEHGRARVTVPEVHGHAMVVFE